MEQKAAAAAACGLFLILLLTILLSDTGYHDAGVSSINSEGLSTLYDYHTNNMTVIGLDYSENTTAASCLKKIIKGSHHHGHHMRSVSSISSSSLASLADASRVIVVLGATLIGEPVTHGFDIVSAQIESLARIGLLCKGCARVHLAITHAVTSPLVGHQGHQAMKRSGKEAITELIHKLDNFSGGEATSRIIMQNEWEYPALHDLHEFATINSSSSSVQEDEEAAGKEPLYLYIHNKGATHRLDDVDEGSNNSDTNFNDVFVGGVFGYNRRTLEEMALFRQVVVPWRQVLAIFDLMGPNKMQHTGLVPADEGWEWFNFWWARRSFLASRLAPIHSADRYYYESWLGREVNTSYHGGGKGSGVGGGCSVAYSLSRCKLGECGDAKYTGSFLSRAMDQMKAEIAAQKPEVSA